MNRLEEIAQRGMQRQGSDEALLWRSDTEWLINRIRVLEAALRPFAKIAALHGGDENEDQRPVSIINLPQGDQWFQHHQDGFLTRGDLRRALEALVGAVSSEQEAP